MIDSKLATEPHAQNESEFLSIADLAETFDITPRAIRFYEDQGLINPQRRGQNRIYSKRDLSRLAWVLRGKRVGFSLAEIAELLDLYDADSTRATQANKTLEKCRQRIVALEDQRRDIDHVIEELTEFTTALHALVALEKTAKNQK